MMAGRRQRPGRLGGSPPERSLGVGPVVRALGRGGPARVVGGHGRPTGTVPVAVSPGHPRRVGVPAGNGHSATLAPAIGDRQPPVPAERLEADLGARRILPSLVLRAIDHPDHPVCQLRIEAHCHDLFVTRVPLYVVVQDVVE